jgi:2-keto-4-pentenoate hydratase/2-oxohepta-3-ene-1,7-dioic acid hydratase in catechol pathway
MKLVSYLDSGRECWGIVTSEGIVDMTMWRSDIETLADLIRLDAYADAAHHAESQSNIGSLCSVHFLPVIPRPEKIICVLRNYVASNQRGARTNSELPEYPPIFLRVWRSQTAHDQPIVKPSVSDTLDWEGELAVIIGREGRNIPANRAMEHVAGYSCYNDASIREWQAHAKQVAAGKNFESTGAFGPWMVTADEIGSERDLKIETRLNGEVVQSSDTGHMIFPIARLIEYASTIFTLVPGDVVVTGTPPGSVFTRNPPVYMKPDDVVEVTIEAIGTLRNRIIGR